MSYPRVRDDIDMTIERSDLSRDARAVSESREALERGVTSHRNVTLVEHNNLATFDDKRIFASHASITLSATMKRIVGSSGSDRIRMSERGSKSFTGR